MPKTFTIICLILIFTFFSSGTKISPIVGRTICIDPGHGGTSATDLFRVGPSGEREEWINLRVALHLRDMLDSAGAKVIMTRTEDVAVGLKERALLAVNNKADVFVSIHHNATADTSVNFPIIYFHGNASENHASVQLGKFVIQHIKKELYNPETAVSLVSDHVIFPESGTAVLRHSYGIPAIIGEASFFTNLNEEQKLKNDTYNKKEAQAYFAALKEYFSSESKPIYEKYSTVKVEPFPVLQEAERMSDIAKLWHQDYEQGKKLYKTGIKDSLQKALKLFTRSVRSFPDSWVAHKVHYYRVIIFTTLSNHDNVGKLKKRIKEYYVVQDIN